MFFVCESILENRHLALLLLGPLYQLHVPQSSVSGIFFVEFSCPLGPCFLTGRFTLFPSDRSSLSTGRYEIILTALISESSRPSDIPREHDGYQYSPLIKNPRYPTPAPSHHGLISHPSCGEVGLAIDHVRNRRS